MDSDEYAESRAEDGLLGEKAHEENEEASRDPVCGKPGRSRLWPRVCRLSLSLLVLLASVSVLNYLGRFVPAGRTLLPWNWDGFSYGEPDLTEAEELGDKYLIGVGKADITGPVVEINLMGYADPKQVGTGLRQRLYSRAFIVGDVSKPEDRFVYLVLDTQSGDTAVRYGILSALRELGPAYDVYDHHNVAVTGTHSHAGPGGWLNYLLPQITSKGFDRQGFRAIVDGAVLSIRRAHESLSPGYLSVGSTKVHGANINRSLFAYLANPEDERARYNGSAEDDGSVEKDMTLVKFRRASDGKNIGVLTWFPTHGTSMLGNNTLIAGDNKGVAAYLLEKSMRGDDTAAEGFVAGFSQASVGDTSPNVGGAWCEDGSGEMCSFENSTCSDGKSQHCHARGPFFGIDDGGTASCFEIGRRQFEPARELYDRLEQEPSPVRGLWVKSFHTFHDMADFAFFLPNGSEVRTCPAALGYSFAAGTSDGPGVFDFTQHDGSEKTTSPVWRVVSHLLKAPTDAQRACHGRKPILLDVGEMFKPYQWTPNVVDVQVFRVGQLIIIVSPGEATTMAGRRWKEAVASTSVDLFRRDYYGRESSKSAGCASSSSSSSSSPSSSAVTEPVVVLGGPANSYTHYITTEEEYGVQRYEGASTLYGPHTLAAYINVTLDLLPYLAARDDTLDGHRPLPPPPSLPGHHHHSGGGGGDGDGGPFPPDNSNRSLSFIRGVVRDAPPPFRAFGDLLTGVRGVYRRGAHVRAVFVGANPRNDLRSERTYAAVEKLVNTTTAAAGTDSDEDEAAAEWAKGVEEEEEEEEEAEKKGGGAWQVVRDDADWSLVFRWRRVSEVMATSEVEIVWETEPWAEPGVYRVRYFGDAKSVTGAVRPIEGVTKPFRLL